MPHLQNVKVVMMDPHHAIQPVNNDARQSRLKQQGCTVWLTGLSGAGKSTIAHHLEHLIFAKGGLSITLDGDQLRQGLCADLGFESDDRKENIRRTGELAKFLASHSMISIASLISPFEYDRAQVKLSHENAHIPFLECFVDAPLSVCKKRDPKGLYQKVLSGELVNFTGIDDIYEPPKHPDLQLKTHQLTAQQCAITIFKWLEKNAFAKVKL